VKEILGPTLGPVPHGRTQERRRTVRRRPCFVPQAGYFSSFSVPQKLLDGVRRLFPRKRSRKKWSAPSDDHDLRLAAGSQGLEGLVPPGPPARPALAAITRVGTLEPPPPASGCSGAGRMLVRKSKASAALPRCRGSRGLSGPGLDQRAFAPGRLPPSPGHGPQHRPRLPCRTALLGRTPLQARGVSASAGATRNHRRDRRVGMLGTRNQAVWLPPASGRAGRCPLRLALEPPPTTAAISFDGRRLWRLAVRDRAVIHSRGDRRHRGRG